MSLEWSLGVLGLLILVALTFFQLGRLSRPPSPAKQPQKQPRHPSVFVDMDDQPPMEIDFEASIHASERPKNPSRNEASG